MRSGLLSYEPRREVSPARALLHPLWWGALGLLALNDHVLKEVGMLPGVVTGKLSDVVGLVVAPALFATVLRLRRERGLLLAHLAVGVVFAGIQLSQAFASLWSGVMGLVGFPWTIVCDPTDLLALPFLVVSWRYLTPVMRQARPGWTRQAAETLLAAVGMLFCMATSDKDEPTPQPPPPGPSCIDDDGDGVCATIDCNDSDPSVTLSCCTDVDLDGICAAFDCDDQDPSIWEDCELACETATEIQAGTVMGDTFFGADALSTTCEGVGGPEQAFGYLVTGQADVLQLVTASVASDRPHVLAARTACALVEAELACVPAGDTIEVLVAPGSTLWLVVEAATDEDVAPFELTVSQAPVLCGDGEVVWPEECDDGNLQDGDGCDAGCSLEEEPQP